jgi:hypothetical protein
MKDVRVGSCVVLTVLILAIAFTGLFPARAGAAGSGKRPNVVMIICDDLNDFITGMGGHPQARTPNIQKLGGEW